MKLTYTPKRGKLAGLPHIPYKNTDGMCVVSKDRFQENYIYVHTLEEACAYLQKGFKIRMQHNNSPASLISLSSIEVSI